MSSPKTLHFLAMSGAGANVEHAPCFPGLDELKEWLFAYAAEAYRSEFNADFESAYDVVEGDKDDRWRATAEWAVHRGREEWFIAERSFASVDANGSALSPQAIVTTLDERYLEDLRAPTPAI
ncbi:hypothetical protein [Bosea sp. RAC05]|uniref:hypothetical protein n=1 Tax=Bosea sp. RAC05 TaxID=1842539 RepID=UPI00083CA990|nr:hypothetical protein [Bosea sp. RAC05]AOG03089.1 hypothetical protein BSY19_4737 [Bosea sp. RAC05]